MYNFIPWNSSFTITLDILHTVSRPQRYNQTEHFVRIWIEVHPFYPLACWNVSGTCYLGTMTKKGCSDSNWNNSHASAYRIGLKNTWDTFWQTFSSSYLENFNVACTITRLNNLLKFEIEVQDTSTQLSVEIYQIHSTCGQRRQRFGRILIQTICILRPTELPQKQVRNILKNVFSSYLEKLTKPS